MFQPGTARAGSPARWSRPPPPPLHTKAPSSVLGDLSRVPHATYWKPRPEPSKLAACTGHARTGASAGRVRRRRGSYRNSWACIGRRAGELPKACCVCAGELCGRASEQAGWQARAAHTSMRTVCSAGPACECATHTEPVTQACWLAYACCLHTHTRIHTSLGTQAACRPVRAPAITIPHIHTRLAGWSLPPSPSLSSLLI